MICDDNRSINIKGVRRHRGGQSRNISGLNEDLYAPIGFGGRSLRSSARSFLRVVWFQN